MDLPATHKTANQFGMTHEKAGATGEKKIAAKP
jgi:hypothetical protein